MSSYDHNENKQTDQDSGAEPHYIVVELVQGPTADYLPVARIVRRRVILPAGLFVATCLSTLFAGSLAGWLDEGFLFGLERGLWYALPLMTILICHEAGHFLQARRYGIYASFPYFIPMPISPFGTFGAVIAMEARTGHRRALFDIGITGPLAGLVPTLIFCVVGLQLSRLKPFDPCFGEPLLFKLLTWLEFGPIPHGSRVEYHPMAFAGWVGLLITALNLLPIGQLDGGHILYGLLRTKAHTVGTLLLLAAAVAVVWQSRQQGHMSGWVLMLFLLMLMGPHPPTANDEEPLGAGRIVLGWLTLAFVLIGFTPTPFVIGS